MKAKNDNESQAESHFCKCKTVGKSGRKPTNQAANQANRQSSEYSKTLSSKPPSNQQVKAGDHQVNIEQQTSRKKVVVLYTTILCILLYLLVFIFTLPFCCCAYLALSFYIFFDYFFFCFVRLQLVIYFCCRKTCSKSLYVQRTLFPLNLSTYLLTCGASNNLLQLSQLTWLFFSLSARASTVLFAFCGLLCVRCSRPLGNCLIGCIQIMRLSRGRIGWRFSIKVKCCMRLCRR